MKTDLIGTWLIEGEGFDEGGILVMCEQGRAIQFLTSKTRPHRNQTLLLWYVYESESHIRFKASPRAEGWLRGIEMCNERWQMTASDDEVVTTFRLTKMNSSSLPDWYFEHVDKGLRQILDEEDSSES